MASQQRELQELTKVLQDSLSKTSGFRSTPMESEISSQQLVNLQAEYNKLSLENKRLTLELERVNKKLLRKDRKNANVAARSRNEYYNKKYLEYRKKYQDSNFKNKMAEDSANYYLSLLAEVQTDVEHLNSEITLQEYKDLTEERDRIKVNLEINTTAYRQKGREIAQLRNLMKENEMHEGTFSELETRKKSAQDDYDRTNDRLRKELSKSRILGSSLKLDLFGYPPDKPEPSKRLLFVMASFFGGFVMLVGLIVLFELLDFSLKTSSIFQARTNLKLLGTFIFLDNLKGLGKRVLGVPQKGKVMHLDKFKELVRKTRFSIENEGKQLVLFTSCKPGVGKSFIIRALADAFVMKKKRVLIIDFNLKNNSLTEFFKPDKFIASKVLPNRKLVDFITKTHIRGVDFIGIEKSEMGLAELMGEDFLKSGFEQLRNMYDYVFVESANLNDFSDSMDLESCVDSVISIFSAQETLKFIDEQSILFLETLQDKYLGSILNRVEFRYVND